MADAQASGYGPRHDDNPDSKAGVIHPGQDVYGRGLGSISSRIPVEACRAGLLVALSLLLAACASLPEGTSGVSPATRALYAAVDDGDFVVPRIPDRYLTSESVRREVDFWTDEPPGSIVVDPYSYFLYYVLGDNRAIRYRVGVGEAGRTFAGRASVGYKRRWPSWTPTANMIRIEPELYGPWAGGMAPGLENPLGSRAMYLYRNGRDSMYRIHGTYEPGSIGNSQSAGCIRMFQQDAMDLYERVDVGARVRVLGPSQTGMGTSPGRPA